MTIFILSHWHFLMTWAYSFAQRERVTVSEAANSSDSHKTYFLAMVCMGRLHFRHVGRNGWREESWQYAIFNWFGKNGYFLPLWVSCTTQMSCLHARAVWRLSEALWGDRDKSHVHLTCCCYWCGLFFFFKALWPRKERYGMNDAQAAGSRGRHQAIYTSRKEKMSAEQWLYTPRTGYAEII